MTSRLEYDGLNGRWAEQHEGKNGSRVASANFAAGSEQNTPSSAHTHTHTSAFALIAHKLRMDNVIRHFGLLKPFPTGFRLIN